MGLEKFTRLNSLYRLNSGKTVTLPVFSEGSTKHVLQEDCFLDTLLQFFLHDCVTMAIDSARRGLDSICCSSPSVQFL